MGHRALNTINRLISRKVQISHEKAKSSEVRFVKHRYNSDDRNREAVSWQFSPELDD